MRLIKYLFLPLLMGVSSLWATSFLPYKSPEVSLKDAIGLVELHLAAEFGESNGFYIQEARCGYFGGGKDRFWLIMLAKPNVEFYFVAVYMDRKVVGGMVRDPEQVDGWIPPSNNAGKRNNP